MEIWDAYDEKFHPVGGVSLVRGDPIPEGLFHLVSLILVRHADGTYLLMQRDPHKHFGGMWEATAGGSALRGEGPFACAMRELREETGITATKLRQLDTTVNPENQTIYARFLCETDCEKDKITLQEGETVAFQWVTKEELLAMSPDELVAQLTRKYVEAEG